MKIGYTEFNLIHVETEPEKCNNGNVTLRHLAILRYGTDDISISKEAVLNGGGEKDEVESIAWISIDDIDKYEWAFNHYNTIKEIISTYDCFTHNK